MDKINKRGQCSNAFKCSSLHFESVAVVSHFNLHPACWWKCGKCGGKTRSYGRGMWKLQTLVITIIMSWDITRGVNEILQDFHNIWKGFSSLELVTKL